MSIGDDLRRAREERKVSLHAIAEKTNISVRFLDALEKGQIEKLPGGIFMRGFVRSYALQVGLDPDETVKAFVAAHPQARLEGEIEEGDEVRRWPAVLAALGLLVVLIALAAGAVYWWTTREVRPVPVAEANDAPMSDAAAVLPAPPPAAPVPTAPPAGDTPVAEPVAASTLPLRLTIVPTGRCWVQVKADGRVRLAREVLPGERVHIEATDVLEIVAGDAGAFAYELNGTPGRPLAAAGRVGRATLTAGNLAEYQAASR